MKVSSTTKSHDGVVLRLRRAALAVIRKRICLCRGVGWGVTRRGGKWVAEGDAVCALGAFSIVEQPPAPSNGESAAVVLEREYALPEGWVRSFTAGFEGWRYLPWCPAVGDAAYRAGQEIADEFCVD